MTKIIMNEGQYPPYSLYFECKGHSDYKDDKTGNNDVCVAVSTICSMLVRYMAYHGRDDDIETVEDGHVVIVIDGPFSQSVSEVFKSARLQFEALAEEYPEHVKIY